MKILEINNIDLPGRVFNGYNFIEDIKDKDIDIKQAVIIKQSNNPSVINMLNPYQLEIYEKLQVLEEKLSLNNVFSITTNAIKNLPEYINADIIHFHMFHNTKLSIASLVDFAKEKKVILSLHDPWFLTGRCVHFFNCKGWKNGCQKCNYLDTLFPFKEDNCSIMWNLKKAVFTNLNIDIVVTSEWMYNLVKSSPIFSNIKKIHLIPFGIDLKKYKNLNKQKELREKYKLPIEDTIIFLRAQKEFKGTEFVLEALKLLKRNKNLTVVTCDQKGLLDGVKNKFNIIDLGSINEGEVIDMMNICDIFLMPSKGESFGMMALEAMACERPVVVFNNSALPTVTNAPDCGVLVADADSKELMKAIDSLIRNPDECKKRGKIGRKLCKEKYSYNDYLRNMKNLYVEVFNEKNGNSKNDYLKYSILEYWQWKKKINKYLIKDEDIKFDLTNIENKIELINKINEYIYKTYSKPEKTKIIRFIQRIKSNKLG